MLLNFSPVLLQVLHLRGSEPDSLAEVDLKTYRLPFCIIPAAQADTAALKQLNVEGIVPNVRS